MSKWTVILLFALVCGCESPVELEIPGDYQAKLIVESHFSPDSVWWIKVGKTTSLLDSFSTSSELIIPDAKVILFGDNNFLDGSTVFFVDTDLTPRRRRELQP